MRISRILITQWIAADACLAAFSAGWLWTYRIILLDFWEDALRWLDL